MSTVAEHFGLDIPSAIGTSRDFWCGVEYEIEDIVGKGQADSRFHIEVDHSLRNNGLEFKSRPSPFNKALEDFMFLHSTIAVGDKAYSERTSTHVHVNVSNLQLKEVRQLVLTYALLEPLFFKFVGETRQNSIFCVPLYYTILPQLYSRDIATQHSKWHKYTAFNLLPLGHNDNTAALGTVEFRHLYGTNNLAVFTDWLTSLRELYTFIEKSPDWDVVKALVSGKTVYQLATTIIPTLTKGLSEQDITTLCQDTLLDVKLANGGIGK